ncbi:MAG TPA: S9 family peptidase [Acidimicrobiia bacterium]|nr:S9 family peptidase [Acidimicrobiia bacterium]
MSGSAASPDRITPPVARRIPHVLREHGDERADDWYWLRNRDDAEVVAYLEAENAYADAMLAPLAPLRERIFEEIKGRIQETDESAPVAQGPWEYTSRTHEGSQYATHCRRPRGAGPEAAQVVLDENALAEGHDYFSLGGFELTPDQSVLAYSVDFNGSEKYTLRFRDVTTGADLPDVVEDVTYGLAWADDGRTCFYVRPDEAMRPHEVWRHELGTPASVDVRVMHEDDERFYLGVERTRSGRFILVDSSSKLTSEVWFVPTNAPASNPRVITPREHGHEYMVEHHFGEATGDRFLIVTNHGGEARNFELVAAPAANPARENWTPLVPHRADVKIDAVNAFAHHLVLTERAEGLERLRVMQVESGAIHEIVMPDPVYSAWVGATPEFDTSTLRYGYTSLVAPVTDVDYDMDDRRATIVKAQPVLGGYDATQYVSARLWATADDGTRIPISLVHRRDAPIDGTAPALIYGYGSYEISTDPSFRSSRLSLLDRGFVFAIAHVRGGGEMGREWYEDGRLEHKMHTFTDFVACAEHLIAHGYTSSARLAARGGSAGGLLMGAVVNLRPDLFGAIVAEVPFVDVVTTMLDPSLPLTITEWEEWGDPREPDAYARMKAYSPYDNVRAADYPALLVTTGLNDPRVQYWEPAKWVAKLRQTSTSGKPIYLRTEMGAGHGGPSGRYDAWRDEAIVLAFVCDAVGAA